MALGGGAIAILGYIAKLEQEDRQIMMTLFGRHVTPKIAEAIWLSRHQLLKKGQLIGQQMTATVLFSDLKGFTTIATRLPPAELMSWLNEYMQVMAQTVLEHDGVIDKFIGDAVMALFGVPIPRTKPEEIAADAIAAVACARAMGNNLRSLNEQWQKTGRPTVAMRVGIATGIVVTGSLGSAQRLDYTVIGDTVNVAARLESYDKSWDAELCRILIGEETYQLVQNHFIARYIGNVYLKGREQPTKIYQVDLTDE
ncbi:adenylate/guanylate cyclase domain-containing protein [Microseira wollei]|uniref:Adenylate cyclase n=1 Tax=Microseira wollei NIES-4236 TaxID=2530354 RepID=A0AAV3X9G4_9CYAN|nr:adenylate/guanylate cyclase domain-containing protein [Microseira wollei]GET37951.1 adenylate cyclase [Microseira wollei NIES-4236]